MSSDDSSLTTSMGTDSSTSSSTSSPGTAGTLSTDSGNYSSTTNNDAEPLTTVMPLPSSEPVLPVEPVTAPTHVNLTLDILSNSNNEV